MGSAAVETWDGGLVCHNTEDHKAGGGVIYESEKEATAEEDEGVEMEIEDSIKHVTHYASSGSNDQVIDRLEHFSHQLDKLSASQRVVEALVKKIYHEKKRDLGQGSQPLSQEVCSAPTGNRVSQVSAVINDATRAAIRSSRTSTVLSSDFSYIAECMSQTPRLRCQATTSTIPPLGHGLRARSFRPPSFSRTHGARQERHQVHLTPIHPDSWKRASMDFISMLVLLYDSLFIPYQLAWSLQLDGWLLLVSWATWAFWCVDLVFGFLTGFHSKDGVVMEFGPISKRYISGAFFPNLLIIIADLIGILTEVYSPGMASKAVLVKAMRFIKLNRIVRLRSALRAGKVAEARDWLATILRAWGLQEQYNFAARIAQLVFYILWVNHLGGCMWHLVEQGASSRWVEENGITQSPDWSPVEEERRTFDYLIRFWWSASAMIAGGSVMVPGTISELAAAVMCIVLGFILSSVLISSLLAIVMEHQDAHKEKNEKLTKLRQFLFQHRIDPSFTVPLMQQVRDRMGRSTELSEGDVEALSLVSPMLRSELWYRVYKIPIETSNPFICACDAMQEGLVKEICFHLLKHLSYGPGQPMFEPGKEAEGAYFVCNGTLEYTFAEPLVASAGDLDSQADQEIPVGKDAWISEVALWVHWVHRGWMDVATPCELVLIEGVQFAQVLKAYPTLTMVVQAYSSTLLKPLTQPAFMSISDLQSPSFQNFVTLLPQTARISLSDAALSVLAKKRISRSSGLFTDHNAGLDTLRKDIDEGVCDLMKVDGEIRRVTSTATLRLEQLNGTILVQLGECVKGVTTPKCRFPSTHVRQDEDPKVAIQRLVREAMADVQDETIFSHRTTQSKQDGPASFHSLKTRCYDTLFYAEITHEDPEKFMVIPSLRSPQPQSMSSSFSWTFGRAPTDLGLTIEAFVFRGQMIDPASTLSIFAWLTSEEFSLLSSKSGKVHLERILAELDLNRVVNEPRAASRRVCSL